MKKKISLLICMLAGILCFTGCAGQKTEVEYDEAFVEQASDLMLSYCESSDEAMIEQFEGMSRIQPGAVAFTAGTSVHTGKLCRFFEGLGGCCGRVRSICRPW